MKRILISASFPESCVARQSFGGNGVWSDIKFLFEPDGLPVDGWVVIDNLQQPKHQFCSPSNTMLVTGEPASVRQYRSRFTSQFGYVWTSHQSLCHSKKILASEFQHWHFGLYPTKENPRAMTFEDLIALQAPGKPKILSVICSNKTVTPDHCQRLRFVAQLKQSLGDQIEVFGRGIREISDKSEAILPYRYHIVLENDHADNFVSEKLPDAFLGWSLPFYSGGQSAGQLFPKDSFIPIDMYRPHESIAIIQNAIKRDEFSRRQKQIQSARESVLWKTNFLAVQANFWRKHLVQEPAQIVKLYPKNHRIHLVAAQMRRLLSQKLRFTSIQTDWNGNSVDLATN